MQKVTDALKNERYFNSALLDTVAALVVVFDREGRIIRFNRACEETTGYTFAEVKKKPYDIFLLPEEVERVKAVFSKLRSGHVHSRCENYWITKEGSLRLIDWSNTALFKDGQVEFIIGTGIDVTECRQSQAEIERLASFPELNPNPVIEVDVRGAIIFYNDAASQTAKKLGLHDLREFLPADLDWIFTEAGQERDAQFYR